MKFIIDKGAPDIPLSILEAQESGKLVFFCGAGVSSKVARKSDNSKTLPLFKELVNNVYDSHGWNKENHETHAIESNQFDTALGLLESRIYNKDKKINLVRREIINNLRIADNANLQTHDALLSLSKTNNDNFRIVTTNADHCFINLEYVDDSQIDKAPKLPIAKPHRWESIVHLHGIIDDDNDKEGNNLIFTSGDFGSAYLTEGWASKFIRELFRNFIVLFVGYSVNDPILKYITDAVAAENRLGHKGFHSPYILIMNESDDDKKYWSSRGIEPIFFYESYDNLHNTLKEWANYCRDGLNGKERIINDNARLVPSKPYMFNDSVTRVLHSLRDEYGVKFFSELKNPPAPIEWLSILVENGLFSLGLPTKIKSFGYGHRTDNLIPPNIIVQHLWNWLLLHHFENEKLIDWIVNNGVFLHPELKSNIRRKLARSNNIKNDYFLFWKIISSNNILFYNINTTGMYLIKDLEKENVFSKKSLIRLLTPKIKILSNNEIYFEPTQSKLFRSEVTIPLRYHIYSKLKSTSEYPQKYIELLPQVSILLNEALKYEELFKRASEDYDLSHVKEEYRSNDGWSILIQICRDLWTTVYANNDRISDLVIDLWKSFKFPVFRRLVLSSYLEGFGGPEEGVDYLLQDEGRWIWSECTRKKAHELIKFLWINSNEEVNNKIIDTIKKYHPESPINDNQSEDESVTFERCNKYYLLEMLNETKIGLPESAKAILDRLESELPTCYTNPSEFKDNQYDYIDTTEKLFENSVTEIVELLDTDQNSFSQELLKLFKSGIKDYSKVIIKIFDYLVNEKVYANHIWRTVFHAFSELDLEKSFWINIAELLANDETELLVEECSAISYWLKEITSKYKLNREEENTILLLCNEMLDNQNPEESIQINNVIATAIGRPVGQLIGAVINLLASHEYKKGEGLSEKHMEILNRVVKDDNSFYRSGKIILASKLSYFYFVDPDWTIKFLLPNFDESNSKDASYLWQGYLFRPVIPVELALEIKDLILSIPDGDYDLDKYDKQYHQLITIICLDYPAMFSDIEKRELIQMVGLEGLSNISELLSQRVFKDEDKQDLYWLNRIEPFIDLVWPRDPLYQNEKTSLNLSMMSLSLSNTFKNAIDFLEPFVNPMNDPNHLYYYIKENELLNKHPKAVFKLLNLTFSDQSDLYDGNLREILNTIISLNPELKSESKYLEMDAFLRKKGL